MDINMEFEGLEDLIKTVEKMATQDELEKTNKELLKECGEVAHKEAGRLIHRSKDRSKSGPQHKGTKRSVPPGHAADNVPKPRFKKKNGRSYIIVGWDKSDNSDYFYMKMEEWGTTKREPHHAFGKVNKLMKRKYDSIATKHYEKLIKKLEK